MSTRIRVWADLGLFSPLWASPKAQWLGAALRKKGSTKSGPYKKWPFDGQYNYEMSFEMTNAHVIFIDYMNRIFRLFLDKFVVVCMKDILIFSKILEDHVEHSRKVLSFLRKK